MSNDLRGLKPRLGAGASLRTQPRAEPALQGRDTRGRLTRNCAGFTLIEVIVALAIGALVVLLAERLFAAVGDASRELSAARTALDREANARRWLAASFLSLEAAPEAGGFAGYRDRLSFASWQETPEEWFARSRVTVGRVGDQLIAAVGPGDSIKLADSVTDLSFDYLLEPGSDAHWVREWISSVSAPLAVRMRIARAGCGMRDAGCVVDTLLFLIKERG